MSKDSAANQKSKKENVEQAEPATDKDFLIVGLGASAGGIQALKSFFTQVPKDSGVAYVVILHMSPEHESKLADILQMTSSIPVTQVRERTNCDDFLVKPLDFDQLGSVLEKHLGKFAASA